MQWLKNVISDLIIDFEYLWQIVSINTMFNFVINQEINIFTSYISTEPGFPSLVTVP
jgi:hypothetical protein